MAIFDALMGSSGAPGWGTVGAVLGGGGAMQQNAYQRGVLQGAQSSNLLEEARKRRNTNLAIQNLQSGTDFSDPTQRNSIIGNALAGGVNLNQLAEGLGNFQKNDIRGQLVTQANDQSVPLSVMNRLAVALDGKPVQTTRVEGNTVINPYIDPNQQADVGGNVPTDIGQADIGLRGAQAANAYASAGEHNAQAQHALATINDVQTDSLGNAVLVNRGSGGTKPVTDGDGNPIQLALKGRAAGTAALKPAALSPTTATQIFGAPGIKGNANPEYQQFEAWRAQMGEDDPRYLNGDFAAQQWQLRKQRTADAISNAVNETTAVNQSPIASALAAPGGSAAPAAVAYSADTPATPKSQADFDALPKGTPYLNPSDGKLYRKN